MDIRDSFNRVMECDSILSLKRRTHREWEDMSRLADELRDIASRYNIVFYFPGRAPMPGATKKDDFRFFDFNGERVKDLRILPPLIDEEAEQQIFRTFRVPREYLYPEEKPTFPLIPPACGATTQIPCKPATWSKFGFGCPFCEMFLNQYPEDRGEGGIE